MGNCLKAGETATGDAPSEKGGKKGQRDRRPPWSWDTAVARKWHASRPKKDEFFATFQAEGEETSRAAKQRYIEGKIPGKECVDVAGTAADRQVKVWRPGELQGYDLSIESLRFVDYYVVDVSGQITADKCEDCRFFVGPCEGSVFLRDCKRCVVICACAQLRMRDCKGCTLMAHAPGRLNIESCQSTAVCGWNVSYFELADQMAKAKLSVFNNCWYLCHDFGTGSMPRHLEDGTTAADIMGADWRTPEAVAGVSGFSSSAEAGASALVPVVCGLDDQSPAAAATFLLFSPGNAAAASNTCCQASAAGIRVAATKELNLKDGDPDLLGTVFGGAEKYQRGFMDGPVVAVLLHGGGELLGQLGGSLRVSVVDGGGDGAVDPQVLVWRERARTVGATVLQKIHHSLDG
eukprot:TRINITY_DN9475_c3_g1_i1.p1 TRINITY_DN9475_c3_g1~~TRINITY_DN9475_c3_g1_i1.p1  ORF type:complete len:434 (+),score=134.50 TRINITY_DN9475_c3_g1_i1:85-1302(+)